MRTALDTNVLSSVWGGEPNAPRITAFLREASEHGGLVIGPVVYVESLGNPSITAAELMAFLEDTRIAVDWVIDRPIWQIAGARYEQYARRRRRDRWGEPKRFIADFLIGAHALLRADRLVTLDQRRYRADFPELNLVEL